MFKEFKEFAVKGNVLDMAVGIIIGAAFGQIVNSFVSDIIMPPLGVVLGGIDLSHFSLPLKSATATTPAVTLNYGLFLNTIIDFLIISFAIFVLVKQINRFKKKTTDQSASPSEEVLLLRDIRDALQK